MGVESIRGMYDCNGRFAATRTYIYMFMARDGDGPMYVKFGRSDDPVRRVTNVQVGCPFRIVKAGMVKCLSIEQAKKVESALHVEFSQWSTSGEWFRFDWTLQEVREEVNARVGMVLNSHIREFAFEQIDLEHAARQHRALLAERKRRSRQKLRLQASR